MMILRMMRDIAPARSAQDQRAEIAQSRDAQKRMKIMNCSMHVCICKWDARMHKQLDQSCTYAFHSDARMHKQLDEPCTYAFHNGMHVCIL